MKITVVGAGAVGATCADNIARRELAEELVLVDIKEGFAEGKALDIMIKGDNNAKYPSFKGVLDALRANEQFKYRLVTDPKGVPIGSDLYKEREAKASS